MSSFNWLNQTWRFFYIFYCWMSTLLYLLDCYFNLSFNSINFYLYRSSKFYNCAFISIWH